MNHPLERPFANWQSLADGPDETAFHEAWLMRMMEGMPRVAEAALVIGPANQGPYEPVALWPQGRPPSPELALACERALDMRLPFTGRIGPRVVHAQPLMLGQDIHGVAAFACEGQQLPGGAREWLSWGQGWLLLRCLRQAGDAGAEVRERLFATLDVMMAAVQEPSFEAAAQAVVTEAAVRLGCDRVSLGFGEAGMIRFAALSHSAEVARRIDLVQALEAAMNEAAEQGSRLWLGGGPAAEPGLHRQTGAQAEAPAVAGGDEDGASRGSGDLAIDDATAPHLRLFSLREHQRLARDFGSGAVLSVPFAADDRRQGVLLFEWAADDPPASARDQAEAMAPLLGRVLLDKRHAHRGVASRLRDAWLEEVQRVVGPRHALRKVALLGSLGLLAFLSLATGRHRVSADATLEGSVRRQIVAPYDGFVATALARAGQGVKAGQVLATLDDRDMRLETQRWESQQEQYARQAQDAEAQANLAQIQIALAQTRQAAAQRALSEAQVQRARVAAPFDGIVVAGDLSQNLGGAVRKGQTLFEIAPLDSYRLVLEVPEGDFAQIRTGQRGRLVLTALTGETLPFTVSLVTPVATAREGKNLFRVEATLDAMSPRLRPGMEGVAKVDVGERRLIWIWTHRFTDWLRLQLWSWLGV